MMWFGVWWGKQVNILQWRFICNAEVLWVTWAPDYMIILSKYSAFNALGDNFKVYALVAIVYLSRGTSIPFTYEY